LAAPARPLALAQERQHETHFGLARLNLRANPRGRQIMEKLS
jgi:hypothetical protein